MPDEARDGRNIVLIDKCFMVCSIVQRRIKLLKYEHVLPNTTHFCACVCLYNIQYNTIQYNTIQYNTIQCHSIQCIAIQGNTMLLNTL